MKDFKVVNIQDRKKSDYVDEYKLEPSIVLILVLSFMSLVGLIGVVVSDLVLFNIILFIGVGGLLLIGLIGSFINM